MTLLQRLVLGGFWTWMVTRLHLMLNFSSYASAWSSVCIQEIWLYTATHAIWEINSYVSADANVNAAKRSRTRQPTHLASALYWEINTSRKQEAGRLCDRRKTYAETIKTVWFSTSDLASATVYLYCRLIMFSWNQYCSVAYWKVGNFTVLYCTVLCSNNFTVLYSRWGGV